MNSYDVANTTHVGNEVRKDRLQNQSYILNDGYI